MGRGNVAGYGSGPLDAWTRTERPGAQLCVLSSSKHEAVPVGGTDINDYPSKRHDASILPDCSPNPCRAGAVVVSRRVRYDVGQSLSTWDIPDLHERGHLGCAPRPRSDPTRCGCGIRATGQGLQSAGDAPRMPTVGRANRVLDQFVGRTDGGGIPHDAPRVAPPGQRIRIGDEQGGGDQLGGHA